MKHRKMWRRAAFLAACLSVSGCQSLGNQDRPAIGSGTDDYRESPCACVDVPQRFKSQYVG